jgi:hypothetical protein
MQINILCQLCVRGGTLHRMKGTLVNKPEVGLFKVDTTDRAVQDQHRYHFPRLRTITIISLVTSVVKVFRRRIEEAP